jgi:hypothetical protein
MNEFRFGFRIVGPCDGERCSLEWPRAFAAYAALDDRADVQREAYLSAFTFGPDFVEYLDATGLTKGFNGDCWSPWLWFDIDREHDIDRAALDARRLAAFLVERYQLDDDGLLLFYSGSKGFHVGLPTSLWLPESSARFNAIARRMAETLAAAAGVIVDAGIYDKVRAFRAPNSRHFKTGRHKRRLSFDELLGLSVAAVLKLAETPSPFDVPLAPDRNPQAVADWQAAAEAVERSFVANAQRRIANGSATLNRSTRDIIRNAVSCLLNGDRHRLLFSAAANLGEFGCSIDLAWSLLSESGLDAGLPPKEVRRQIECGLQHATRSPITSETATPQPIAGEPPTPQQRAGETPTPRGQLFDRTEGGYYDAGL